MSFSLLGTIFASLETRANREKSIGIPGLSESYMTFITIRHFTYTFSTSSEV